MSSKKITTYRTYIFKRKKQEVYIMRTCTQCHFRTERTYIRKGKIEFLETPPEKIITNKAGFCRIGFSQNPKNTKAKANALKNGARLCSFGMVREEGWSLLDLALAHATSLNRALSALPFKVRIKDYL